MTKLYQLQSSFNNGVLDETLNARVDVKQYYQGISQGDNVLCIPQGGLKRRQGMQYVATSSTQARVIPFVFNLDQRYVLVFRNNAIDVYYNDTFQATVVTTYTTAQLYDIQYTQSADTMILVHESHNPKTLVRGATHTSWTLSNITFDYIPQYDFNDASSPTPVSEIQAIAYTATVEGTTMIITLGGIDTEEIAISNDATTFAQNIEDALYELPNTASTGITVAHGGGTTAVTFAGANADAWDLMVVRAVNYIGTTKPTMTVSRVQAGTTRKEDVWSATRGWPKTVTFHEGRLYFGGSTQRPVSVWGSQVNDFFNFDLGKSRDDEGLDVALDTDQYDAITAIHSGRHLQIFTAGAEYYVPKSPITPATVGILRQTQYGSKNIKPVNMDGATMYIQRTGKSIREFIYDFAEEAYLSSSVSFLAPNLINNPIDMAVSRGTTLDDSNYVYLVNTDGTMAVLNTLREQNVSAWTKWVTDGEIQSIAAVGDDIYFSTKRTINSSTVYYIEKANPNTYTDCCKVYTSPATATLTGLSHLEAEQVRVRADGAVLGNETVASGQITIDRTAVDSAEVGLNYEVNVKTMPVQKDVGAGQNLNGEKRIVNCSMLFKDTLGIQVNGYTIPFKNFGTGVLDQPVTPFSGKKEIYLLGWSKTAQVTITQQDPTPMTLLAINLEVEVG